MNWIARKGAPETTGRSDGDIAHQPTQLRWQAVERLADHRLESLGLNIDQAVIVRPHGAGWDKPDATVTG